MKVTIEVTQQDIEQGKKLIMKSARLRWRFDAHLNWPMTAKFR